MSENVKNFIDSVNKQDYATAKTEFQTAMAERVNSAFENKKIELAQNMTEEQINESMKPLNEEPVDAPNDPQWKEKLVDKMVKAAKDHGKSAYSYSQLSMWMEGALGESMFDKDMMTGGPDHRRWSGLVKEIADKVEEKADVSFSK